MRLIAVLANAAITLIVAELHLCAPILPRQGAVQLELRSAALLTPDHTVLKALDSYEELEARGPHRNVLEEIKSFATTLDALGLKAFAEGSSTSASSLGRPKRIQGVEGEERQTINSALNDLRSKIPRAPNGFSDVKELDKYQPGLSSSYEELMREVTLAKRRITRAEERRTGHKRSRKSTKKSLTQEASSQGSEPHAPLTLQESFSLLSGLKLGDHPTSQQLEAARNIAGSEEIPTIANGKPHGRINLKVVTLPEQVRELRKAALRVLRIQRRNAVMRERRSAGKLAPGPSSASGASTSTANLEVLGNSGAPVASSIANPSVPLFRVAEAPSTSFPPLTSTSSVMLRQQSPPPSRKSGPLFDLNKSPERQQSPPPTRDPLSFFDLNKFPDHSTSSPSRD